LDSSSARGTGNRASRQFVKSEDFKRVPNESDFVYSCEDHGSTTFDKGHQAIIEGRESTRAHDRGAGCRTLPNCSPPDHRNRETARLFGVLSRAGHGTDVEGQTFPPLPSKQRGARWCTSPCGAYIRRLTPCGIADSRAVHGAPSRPFRQVR
jgi:hypothetical protein